jgi:hypothetical protein
MPHSGKPGLSGPPATREKSYDSIKGFELLVSGVDMDDATRNQIAECFEQLAAEPRWNGELWRRCYDLVTANLDDELVGFTMDELIHYSGRPLFRSEPRPEDLQSYAQEFRDYAAAIRSRLSVSEYQDLYE